MTGPEQPPVESQRRSRITEEERRRRRRESAVIVAAGVAVLIFALWEIRSPGLHGTSGNVFSFLLVNLNIVLLLLLIFLVVRNLVKLVIERRENVPGSQLRSRTVLAFVAVALFPAIVMLLVSLEFITNTIDGWFSTEVEQSLSGALELAQAYYERSAEDALMHSRELSHMITEEGLQTHLGDPRLDKLVREHQQAYGLGTVQVFDARGEQVLARFNRDAPTGLPMHPNPDLMSQTLAGQQVTRIESFGDGDIIQGSSPIYRELVDPPGHDRAGTAATAAPAAGHGPIVGAVVVDYLVEHSPRQWSSEILDSFQAYRQLKLNKRPFKNLYVLTMALASLVVVFSATWMGLYLARGITEPLGRLVDATRRVAEGDWSVELAEPRGDEIGTLVRSFNSMTAQLKSGHEALEERRRYTENILRNIDAGVVSVDASGRIGTVNPAAVSLLGLLEEDVVGHPAREVFAAVGYPEIATLLEDLDHGAIASGTRRNILREEEGRTLLAIATSLGRSTAGDAGSVLFFEDVSQIVEVQRMEAWREVARRIAHEIKNPLTPIQLSAQRLHRRLREKVSGEDAEVFDDCTSTIVKEVDELKHLVNEFSQFARRSAAAKRPQDLNQLVEETMPLYRQARPDLEFGFEPDASLPAVVINRESVKRALVNLLDNAVAAVTGDGDGRAAPAGPGRILVRTHFDSELSRVVLEVTDTGPGIPHEFRGRIFEPYFSTKTEGTGLGLAIVASIAADHHAYVRMHDNEPHGCRFVIEFPTA
jgi:two-component system nitrogen regulation sensor histidine kinase NtrY